MNCLAFCTAAAFRFKPLFEELRKRYQVALYRNAIHSEIPIDGITANVFYFSYGSVVCWGVPKEKCVKILEEVKPFEDQPLEEIETDEFTYIYGDSAKIIEDEIVLPNPDKATKLAVSHGLAQTVKLGTFENAIQKTFKNTKHIPEDLAERGKISLSKRETRRRMGQLFIQRASINLHADVLDTPEFFWEFPELEFLYVLTANYLDLGTRVEVLNKRLDVIHDLFQMLDNEITNRNASRLEWTVILLIMIEVSLALFKDVFNII